MPGAVMCAVNIAEVAQRLRRDHDGAAVRASLALVLPLAITVDKELALDAGLMEDATRATGLSLGDRFCLVLAARMKVPALTADQAWVGVARKLGGGRCGWLGNSLPHA